MQDNKIAVYTFDTITKLFASMRLEDADYQPKGGETLTAIPDGLRPPYKWTGSNWAGSTEEEFEKAFPLPEALKKANEEYEANKDSQKTLNADLMKQVAQLTVSNATAVKQLAELQAQNTTQAQVNASLMKDSAALKVKLAQLTKPTEQPAQGTNAPAEGDSKNV